MIDLEFPNNIAAFIEDNLKQSLTSIGFSKLLVSNLVNNLSSLDIEKFGKEFKEELERVYRIGFFQKIVPGYFVENVIPLIPKSHKVLDIGCGTGILAKVLSQSNKFDDILGIDINEYPEWKEFNNVKVRFKIINENDLPALISEYKPDMAILTWTLHHMSNEEQVKYLQTLHNLLPTNSNIIILEDCYSENMKPEYGGKVYDAFMRWGQDDRKKIMSVYDWVANKVLAQRKSVPMPYSYRTLEEWLSLSKHIGFGVVSKRFIGFPVHRDINTPQSVFVLRK